MSDPANPERSALGTVFDREYRRLHGLPDATAAKPTTIRHIVPVIELAQTFIVQTVRHKEAGDFAFVEYVGTEGSVRIVLPPSVTEALARQREALTARSRSRAAKAEAARRKAAGIKPGFMKGKGKAAKGGGQ